MRRQWNFTNGPQGSGRRFAQALACISTEEYVRSVIAVHQALAGGVPVRIVAERAKFDAEGNQLEGDDVKLPGDYLTVGYRFTVENADEGGDWIIDRDENFEGERSAEDLADALGLATDREFCETMVQTKCLLDRIGGQLFLRPYVHEQSVVGLLCHYEHLVRDQAREPDADLDQPLELPGESGPRGADDDSRDVAGARPPEGTGEEDADSPPSTPEEEHAAIEAERVGA